MWFGFRGETKPTEVPDIVPTDKIVPLNIADDTAVLRSVVVCLSYRFDDQLDPEHLRDAFWKLLDRPGWRKIGARLRANVDNGKLEYHIPAHFDEKRPIVNWSQAHYDMSVNDHPLGKKLPRPTKRPAVVADPNEFNDFYCGPKTARTVEEYLTKDLAQLSVHVVTFTDTTLISVSLPHTLTDATGGAMIYKCWSLVLQGRESEIPPFHAYDYDPLASFGETRNETYIHEEKMLTGWRRWLFTAYQIYDAWRYPTSSRIVCIPRDFLANQRKKAIVEVQAETGNDKAFVSDNDLITAWFSRLVSSIFPKNSNKTVRIMCALSLAQVLAGTDRMPSGKAYISNATAEIYTFVPVRDFFQKPLSAIAWAVRKSMMQGAVPGQLEAQVHLKKNNVHYWPIFGDASMEMISYSNWTKAKLMEVDFSPAIAKVGFDPQIRPEKIGYGSMVQFNAWTTGFDLKNLMPIMGKDAAGNYWLQGPLREITWKQIEKELEIAEGGLYY